MSGSLMMDGDASEAEDMLVQENTGMFVFTVFISLYILINRIGSRRRQYLNVVIESDEGTNEIDSNVHKETTIG